MAAHEYPLPYDITIRAGVAWQKTFTWKDSAGTLVNLTGWTARLQAREHITDTATVLELSTSADGITLGGSAGTITLRIEAAESTTLVGSFNRGVYDLLLLAPGGDATPLLAGAFVVNQGVTR